MDPAHQQWSHITPDHIYQFAASLKEKVGQLRTQLVMKQTILDGTQDLSAESRAKLNSKIADIRARIDEVEQVISMAELVNQTMSK
jgi:hypothetical protein